MQIYFIYITDRRTDRQIDRHLQTRLRPHTQTHRLSHMKLFYYQSKKNQELFKEMQFKTLCHCGFGRQGSISDMFYDIKIQSCIVSLCLPVCVCENCFSIYGRVKIWIRVHVCTDYTVYGNTCSFKPAILALLNTHQSASIETSIHPYIHPSVQPSYIHKYLWDFIV